MIEIVWIVMGVIYCIGCTSFAGYSIYNCCKSKNKYEKIDLYDTELPNVTEQSRYIVQNGFISETIPLSSYEM